MTIRLVGTGKELFFENPLKPAPVMDILEMLQTTERFLDVVPRFRIDSWQTAARRVSIRPCPFSLCVSENWMFSGFSGFYSSESGANGWSAASIHKGKTCSARMRRSNCPAGGGGLVRAGFRPVRIRRPFLPLGADTRKDTTVAGM